MGQLAGKVAIVLGASYEGNMGQAIARLFRAIAIDETRHAALAVDVGRWLEATLPADERTLVDRARHDEVEALAAALTQVEQSEDTASRLGTPSPVHARVMLAGAFPAAWA